MANPAPFPSTAYDTNDWLRATTLYTSGVTPAPSTGGAPPIATNYQSVEVDTSSTSRTVTFGPSDGKQHYLLTAHIQVQIVAATISGVAVGVATLEDASNGVILGTNCYLTGFPTAGQLPVGIARMAWAGGLTIPVQANTVNQLQIVVTVQGVSGGTISSFSLQSQTYVSWV